MFTYHIKMIPSKLLHQVKIYKYGEDIADLNFSILKNNEAILNHIKVNNIRQGHGSQILKDFESFVNKKYDINYVSLLAYEPSGENKVVNFFEKNGYSKTCSAPQTYDDSILLYDLHEMFKKL